MSRRYSPKKDYADLNASFQGVDLSSNSFQMYSGIDDLKNMSIQDDHIYVSVSTLQQKIISSGQQLPTDKYPALSGYFTDEATASRHFNGDSWYSAVKLADDLQQAPYYDPDAAVQAAINGEEYFPKFNSELVCFTIDRDQLEKIYGTRDLNAAVGKCMANDHLGRGGGNQGFNSDLTEFYNNGCLKYDPSRSRTSNDVLCRNYDAMQSRAEARTQDCLNRHERTPSIAICTQTSVGSASIVPSPPFHSTEIRESTHYTGLHGQLHDPDLFRNNAPADYQYVQTAYGKFAQGVLGYTPGQRNPTSQRTVGGEDRLPTDDGGHLIGARFQGSGNIENLEAQDRNLNRGSYKKMENRWAAAQDAGDKIFAHSESFHSNQSQRPDAFMGYAIYEHPDGTREWEAFSYQNESSSTQQEWNDALNQFDPNGLYMDDYINPRNYDPKDYEAELNDMDFLEQGKSSTKKVSNQNQNEHQGKDQEKTPNENHEQFRGKNQKQGLSNDQSMTQITQQEQEHNADLSMEQIAHKDQNHNQNLDQNQDLNEEQNADLSMEQIAHKDQNHNQNLDQNQDLNKEQNADSSVKKNAHKDQNHNQNLDQNQDLNEEQNADLSVKKNAQKDQNHNQNLNDDLSMDQITNQDVSGIQEQDNSNEKDRGSSQDENQSLGYSY